MDGQWYVFMINEDGTVIAHQSRQLASDVLLPHRQQAINLYEAVGLEGPRKTDAPAHTEAVVQHH